MVVLPSLEVSLTLPGLLSRREHHSREENDNDSLFTHSDLCACVTPSLTNTFLNSPLGLEGPSF